ncbi:potassium channel family protein [Prescottella defluvii]|uniref:potassium channel family protein n=1 Tax=Prescottella defluvii TaxID=1323361 RepID=UPI0004F3A1F4|nr:potassium channel family protein [Prescottella defluvii]
MSDPGLLQELDKHERRRLLRRALLPPIGTVVVLTVAYFVLPMDHLSNAGTVAILVGGVMFVVVLCIWQVRQILRSTVPALRSASALMVTLPVYLLGSSVASFLLSQMNPESFTEPLTRIDALYFTLTVFATVGFGDIAAVEQTARAVVTAQIVGNLVMLAVGVRLLTEAVRWSRARRGSGGGADAPKGVRTDD